MVDEVSGYRNPPTIRVDQRESAGPLQALRGERVLDLPDLRLLARGVFYLAHAIKSAPSGNQSVWTTRYEARRAGVWVVLRRAASINSRIAGTTMLRALLP
jgi:hypothetical protein